MSEIIDFEKVLASKEIVSFVKGLAKLTPTQIIGVAVLLGVDAPKILSNGDGTSEEATEELLVEMMDKFQKSGRKERRNLLKTIR